MLKRLAVVDGQGDHVQKVTGQSATMTNVFDRSTGAVASTSTRRSQSADQKFALHGERRHRLVAGVGLPGQPHIGFWT
ncbi:hypothetical protein [Nocardia jinanensis]|uniref:hypothetical protein n=1 Tax=Nocardia jinanensis TaxID=382504 RepID=UPI00073859C0|nr:hypothetical protein [Nocardia jinanensis]